jgi:hypothetical protein
VYLQPGNAASALSGRQIPQFAKEKTHTQTEAIMFSLRSPSTAIAAMITTRKEKAKMTDKLSSLSNPESQHSGVSLDPKGHSNEESQARVGTFKGRGPFSKASTATTDSKPKARCVSFKAPSTRQKFSARNESQLSDNISDPTSLVFTDCSQSETVASEGPECPSESLESGSRHLRASMKLVELVSLYDELEGEDF